MKAVGPLKSSPYSSQVHRVFFQWVGFEKRMRMLDWEGGAADGAGDDHYGKLGLMGLFWLQEKFG